MSEHCFHLRRVQFDFAVILFQIEHTCEPRLNLTSRASTVSTSKALMDSVKKSVFFNRRQGYIKPITLRLGQKPSLMLARSVEKLKNPQRDGFRTLCFYQWKSSTVSCRDVKRKHFSQEMKALLSRVLPSQILDPESDIHKIMLVITAAQNLLDFSDKNLEMRLIPTWNGAQKCWPAQAISGHFTQCLPHCFHNQNIHDQVRYMICNGLHDISYPNSVVIDDGAVIICDTHIRSAAQNEASNPYSSSFFECFFATILCTKRGLRLLIRDCNLLFSWFQALWNLHIWWRSKVFFTKWVWDMDCFFEKQISHRRLKGKTVLSSLIENAKFMWLSGSPCYTGLILGTSKNTSPGK